LFWIESVLRNTNSYIMSSEAEAMMAPDPSAPAAATPAASSKAKKRSSSGRKKKPTPKASPQSKTPVSSKVKDAEMAGTSAAAPQAPETKSMRESAQKTTPAKTTPSRKGKKTMTEMVEEAIRALKDRTGSSVPAITKYIVATYPQHENNTFRSRLSQALKRGVKMVHFAKVKASYKISAEWTKKEKQKKAREATKKIAEKKKKTQSSQKNKNVDEAKRIESLSKSMSPEELEELKQRHEIKLKKQKLKEEVERKAKERLERLRRRRFPMEDTRLHNEDKEFGLAPPKGVKRRPGLPYFFQIARDSKSTAQNPSRCDAVDNDSRGLAPDLMQVYHFFRGDVSFCDLTDKKMVCDFRLSHLIYATDEVLLGNAKKSRMIPPLLAHLFCVCLSILTNPVGDGTTESREQTQLNKDLKELGAALNSASWPEVCCMYMECMDRYYKSPSSQDPSVLKGGVTDVNYLFRLTHTPDFTQHSVGDIPDGYNGYFASKKSTLAKAFDKLNRHDSWTLQAEELLALLRALTDDVLATRPDITVEISEREEKLAELARTKRSADSNFRKVKLAVEGPPPKKPVPQKKDDKKDDRKSIDSKKDETEETKEKEKPFKPTATKKQFEQAKRDQKRANEAYTLGLQNLISRTEPFGFDRQFNRYFVFSHDPEFVFIEMNRSTTGNAEHLPTDVQVNRTSWHAIDKVSVLDQFAASLDVRGHREKALYEVLMGSEDSVEKPLKSYMYDDVKEKNAISVFKDERKAVELKLEEVKLNHVRLEEEGRRPSRFQMEQVSDLDAQIAVLTRKIADAEIPYVPNYAQLTGLDVLRKFDNKVKRHTRRTISDSASPIPCVNLIPSGSTRSGTVGCIVDEVLNVEKLCQDLVPWEEEEQRTRWVRELDNLATTWNEACSLVIGHVPKEKAPPASPSEGVLAMTALASPVGRMSLDSIGSVKRRKLDSPASAATPGGNASSHQILSQLKQPLLELEERIYEISGLAMADRDQTVADDNMSAGEEETEEDLEREKIKKLVAWRKKVHLIRSTPAKRPAQIRDYLVQAIAAARKANQGSIVAKLRAVLLLYHSDAAGDCKQAAITVLDEHGGYDAGDDDEEEGNSGEEKDNEEPPVPSSLCFEAMSLLGSLGDNEEATRSDWTEAVQQCKAISRLAALSTAFCRKSTSRLEKLLSERQALEKALEKWEREENKKRAGKKQTRKVVEPPTEMWANVDYTDNFCMVTLDNHPWWPAKMCVAKDKDMHAKLKSFDRVLVAMVGEHGELRCVKNEDTRKFTGNAMDEDQEQFTKTDRAQLEESLAIARRIIRGRGGKLDEDEDYVEEKKIEAN